MRRREIGLKVFGVLFVILLSFGLSWGVNPPTLLVVVRAADDSLWKMTCDEAACSPFASFPGMFRYQPTVTWDETAQEWVIMGTASNNSIWMATFNKSGSFNNDWQAVPGSTPSPAGIAGGPVVPRTITVTCPGQSLQAAVNAAQPGAVINVTGTCSESVTIPDEKQELTLDGQNVATLTPPTSTNNALTVRGKGILIQNFTITGGLGGIYVNRGASATINHNNIHNTGAYGITVNQLSFAAIKNNTIQSNPQDGINVSENSTVRIGFDFTNDSAASPNTIQNNGGRGITVSSTAHAGIAGNTIVNNTGDGIGVFRGSSANIASNTINGNGGDGVNVGHNSSIFLGEDSPVSFFDQPNITTANNTRYGIECSTGAFVKAHLGSTNQINGALGQTSLSSNCPNSILTP
jgi:hypothetical protein